jgi:SAM-dependent methyltransferase
MIEPILKLEEYPFFIGPVMPGVKVDVPASLPFCLEIHPKYAVPCLVMTDEIRRALASAYSFGSMASTPLGESPLSIERMNEVLEKLLSLFGGDVENAKFLEIGCGSGALLNKFKERGAKVMGIEIGPQGQEGAKKYGFEVIDKPLMSGLLKEKFDCIYSYGCLEHIIDLDEIFMGTRECLEENGLFFHVVPNSELYFASGSLDHLAHEHVNYFTAENGVRLFDSQGFCPAEAATSKAGNELFLFGRYDSRAELIWPGDYTRHIPEEIEKLKEYTDKAIINRKRIMAALKKMQSRGQSIGFYAGGYEYGILLDDKNIRYFDGDVYKHGKSWLVGLSHIESPLALRTQPVDNLVVCKGHYFNSIVRYLKEEINIPDSIKIHELDSLGY